MLFSVVYKSRNPTEESQKRSLELFTSWQPPFEFKSQYAFADGSGGTAIIEAESVAQLLEGASPWWPFFDFEILPVLPIEEAVPVSQKVYAWRDSVG
jgi:uncharacterized protein DUF3303